MQGLLSFPHHGIDKDHGYCYDRDPSRNYLAWNGDTEGSENNNPGTHFQAVAGELILAFAPGKVVAVLPNSPENWVWFIVESSSSKYNIALAHNSEVIVDVGQKVSRYQSVAKAGNRGCLGCEGASIIHLQFTQFDREKDLVQFLDPYKPIFPYDFKNSGGCWANNNNGTNYHWSSLPPEQNPNWENYWIVEDQTKA